jgi:hypothetical protein
MSDLIWLSSAKVRLIEPYFSYFHRIPRVDDPQPCGGIAACIPSKVNRNVPIPHDTTLHRQRHRIENMFGKLKDFLSVI